MTISSVCDPAGNIMHCDASGIKPEFIKHGLSGMMLYQMSTVTE